MIWFDSLLKVLYSLSIFEIWLDIQVWWGSNKCLTASLFRILTMIFFWFNIPKYICRSISGITDKSPTHCFCRTSNSINYVLYNTTVWLLQLIKTLWLISNVATGQYITVVERWTWRQKEKRSSQGPLNTSGRERRGNAKSNRTRATLMKLI